MPQGLLATCAASTSWTRPTVPARRGTCRGARGCGGGGRASECGARPRGRTWEAPRGPTCWCRCSCGRCSMSRTSISGPLPSASPPVRPALRPAMRRSPSNGRTTCSSATGRSRGPGRGRFHRTGWPSGLRCAGGGHRVNLRWGGPQGAGGTSLLEAAGVDVAPTRSSTPSWPSSSTAPPARRTGGRRALADEFRHYCSTIGRLVAVDLGSSTVHGEAVGLSDQGCSSSVSMARPVRSPPATWSTSAR